MEKSHHMSDRSLRADNIRRRKSVKTIHDKCLIHLLELQLSSFVAYLLVCNKATECIGVKTR